MGDEARNSSRKVTFDLPDESEGEDVEDILGGKPKPESKSSFEKRQDKVCFSTHIKSIFVIKYICFPVVITVLEFKQMTKKIEELEKVALSEKPWQLMGEVTDKTRPENSMLEEDVMFDQCSRTGELHTDLQYTFNFYYYFFV